MSLIIAIISLIVSCGAVYVSWIVQKRNERLVQYQYRLELLKGRYERSLEEAKQAAKDNSNRGERMDIFFNNKGERNRIEQNMKKEFNLKDL